MATPTICIRCLSQGRTKRVVAGSFAIELFLWLVFLVLVVTVPFAGLLFGLVALGYSLWRLSAAKTVCTVCQSGEVIPLDSPRGQELLRSRTATP